MYLQLVRFNDNGSSTVGTLYKNGKFEAFSLEDTFNEPKIYGNTRIPDGTYNIKLRNDGRLNEKYSDRYGVDHKGMLWLQNVENFEWVYIHVGNTHRDTDGCILVGLSCDSSNGTIGNSRTAYEKLYNKVASAILNGEQVTIQVI